MGGATRAFILFCPTNCWASFGKIPLGLTKHLGSLNGGAFFSTKRMRRTHEIRPSRPRGWATPTDFVRPGEVAWRASADSIQAEQEVSGANEFRSARKRLGGICASKAKGETGTDLKQKREEATGCCYFLSLVRWRRPTLPLSQYHRRGKV